MKQRIGEKIRLTSIDELLGVPDGESTMELSLSEIHGFKNHPFKVLDDLRMQELVESIRNKRHTHTGFDASGFR